MMITNYWYVVKARSPEGLEHWICPAIAAGGYRTFGPRETAEVFSSRLDAHTAIDSLPSVMGVFCGIAFTIETFRAVTEVPIMATGLTSASSHGDLQAPTATR
jgi:hypothetical protein